MVHASNPRTREAEAGGILEFKAVLQNKLQVRQGYPESRAGTKLKALVLSPTELLYSDLVYGRQKLCHCAIFSQHFLNFKTGFH